MYFTTVMNFRSSIVRPRLVEVRMNSLIFIDTFRRVGTLADISYADVTLIIKSRYC